MGKHTPGPWEIDTNNHHAATIAIVHLNDGATWRDIWSPNAINASPEELDSDASLIAAAPDLLEACKMALMYANASDHETIAMLDKVIAKAEGRK